MRNFVVLSILLGLVVGATADAQSVPPLSLPDLAFDSAPPPARLAEAKALAPFAMLKTAEEGAADELAALKAWNDAGNRPLRVGIVRSLPTAKRIAFDSASEIGAAELKTDGSLTWTGSVKVAGAGRLRLQLTDVELPPGTQLWVYSRGGKAVPFGTELMGPEATLWTPGVFGDEIVLEALLPAGSRAATQGFRIERVSQTVVHLEPPGAKAGECLVDATCVGPATLDVIAQLRRAVAQILFVSGSFEFACSGGLLNDTDDNTVIPYFLTANHCISTQAEASTLDALWDYATTTCNGNVPPINSLPQTVGSTLLATGESSDFTLLQLSSLPGNRVLLGWDANPVPNNTLLHRISHPVPEDTILPQSYTRYRLRTSGVPTCTGLARPQFIYSEFLEGGTFGGSSGAPVILAGGFVVGQLSGACGPDPADGCNFANAEIDGAFSQTFPFVSPFLMPATAGPCEPDGDTLCLNNGRFRVEATFETGGGLTGTAQVVKLTDETGYLWFFNANNVEAVIKVLNACGLNNRYWVFAGGLTDVEVRITVTDSQNGASRVYNNPQGAPFQPIQDTNAFATCP